MLFVVLLIITGTFVIAGGDDFQLVGNKIPKAEFVLPEQSPDSAKLAVKDFNADLKRVTGAELPVKTAPSADLQRIVFDFKTCDLMNDDKFEITFPNPETMQINASPRSVKWALNHILEEFAGVRWLFPGEHGTHWPSKSDIAIPCLTISKQASFSLERYLSYPINTWQINLNAKDVLKFNHELTVYAFPVEKYLANQSWPAEIMPVIRGKKLTAVTGNPRGDWQPCYSNQKTVEVAVENICEYLKKNLSAKCVSIGVNDNLGFCECDTCLVKVAGKKNSINQNNYSDIYYNWANQVAEGVSARYPDVYFGCLAYCYVMDPPSFKLHPKIVPFIAFDTYACLDPGIRINRFKLIEEWSKKASSFGRWDYSFSKPRYQLPRIYFNLQKDILKRTYELGCRAMFVEAYPNVSDGPSKYLLMKLLWDVTTDVDKLLDDWYLACVGDKAAPFLKEYFQFWEKYWGGDDIMKTPWFVKGKNGVYLEIGGPNDYFLALKPGDLAKCRNLMEQMQANALTPEQHARAKIIMLDFEFYELSAKAYNAEKISVHGSLDNEAQAIELIRNIPNALDSANKKKELIEKNSLAFPDKRHMCMGDDSIVFTDEQINLVSLFIDSPKVQAAISELITNKAIPDKIRSHAGMMLALASDKPMKNLLPGQDNSLPFGGKLSEERTFRGTYSGKEILKGNRAVLSCTQNVATENTYMLSARIFLESGDNGIVEVWMYPHNSKTGRDAKYKDAPHPSFKLIPGKWNMVCSTLSMPKPADTAGMYLLFRNLDGKAVYVDDVQLVAIEP
jgi:hypothetical protein